MKQVIIIVMMLLASGGTGRATVMCARLLCPTQVMACCCQDTAQEEELALTMPMNCSDPVSTPQGLSIKTASAECCTVSLAPQKQDSELMPKLSGDTLKTHDEAQVPGSSPILPALPLGRTAYAIDASRVCPGRSEIYLLVASLRI